MNRQLIALLSSDTRQLLREEPLDGKPCSVIESVPKGRASVTRMVAWIDPAASALRLARKRGIKVKPGSPLWPAPQPLRSCCISFRSRNKLSGTGAGFETRCGRRHYFSLGRVK
ncbi:MAG: hypothetical protein AAB466_14505 [Verrucomicrobiota bacterium]